MMKNEYLSITEYCLNSSETDSVRLINQIMDMDGVPIHGPIHHFIMPAVLLTCHNNIVGGDKETLKRQLAVAAQRAEPVPGGNCASCGVCGAALGFGQFASILTGNDPYKEESWSKVMEITAACSLEMAKNGGPRCCKRDAYITLTTGAKEIERLLGVKVKAEAPVCKYFPKNNECRKEKCLFYPKKKEKAAE